LHFVKAPYLLRQLSKNLIHWEVKSTEKVLYYTFDDGPIPRITPQVLEILSRYQAKATFFMVGDNVRKYPEVYQQVIKEGHAVGNHTFNHLKGFSTSKSKYLHNIEKAATLIPGKLFRPPHGQITPRQLKAVSRAYNVIMWSVLTGDYDARISPKNCLKNITDYAKSGSIIVLHDSLKSEQNMIFALEESLKHYSSLGYRFDSLKQFV
jgi:peptidoglycan/xylan/chitin deacetylase (PgdA/CDA1 family)